MNSNNHGPSELSRHASNRRRLVRMQNNRNEGGVSDTEVAASASSQHPQPLRRRSTRSRLATSSTGITDPNFAPPTSATPSTVEVDSITDLGSGESRLSLFSQGSQSRRAPDSAVGSPSRAPLSPTRTDFGLEGMPELSPYEIDLSIALENGFLGNDLRRNNAHSFLRRAHERPQPAGSHPDISAPQATGTVAAVELSSDDEFNNHSPDHISFANNLAEPQRLPSWLASHEMGGPSKRQTERALDKDGNDLVSTLERHGAVTAMLYRTTEANPEADDIWPYFRSKAKLPVRYALLKVSKGEWDSRETQERRSQLPGQDRHKAQGEDRRLNAPLVDTATSLRLASDGKGRPLWQLPVELVEQIIEHLNRDDIKSLRLVSRELNDYTSQAAFKTVVVPFNTEIYGMLGQEAKFDRKGKQRARISRPEYWWKNSNGDEVYNGHGLDVFRGFGRHIRRYGMSFEVNEDSLSAPPLKSTTEQRTSFWGNYDWPFEEYRRFDAVAGLESAADETPRMKIAFSELTKVKELALSIDSGLGWLNGPDLSIRARILQAPRSIFGTHRDVSDRRSQAQQELWHHIEDTHIRAGEDIRIASLYRLEGARPLPEAQDRRMLAAAQPTLPFLDSRVPHEATPHDTTDAAVSQPLNDPNPPDHHVVQSSRTNAGVLFTSATLQQNDAAQIPNPVAPATLSHAQKEWLLETEWAQRAFLSSYMLSIIDNRATFHSIHTLTISSLSDRYLSVLNRADFWNALPNLTNVTLMVIAGWRNVEKDEAGFVETPRIDPTGQVDTFCSLLQAQVAPRYKISKLAVGYTTGGEHAEGLHGRNKLLMPAPLLPLRARLHEDPAMPQMDTATVQDISKLRSALAYFPHLEKLTLRNCWITPSALNQFVKVHDDYALRHLALESVSLTAVLRPAGNVQAVHGNQQAVPVNAPPVQQAPWAHGNNNHAGGHAVAGNGQALSHHVQTLIGQVQQMQANAGSLQQHHQLHALQTQLQQQLQNAQALTAQQMQSTQALTAPPRHHVSLSQAHLQFQQSQAQIQQQQQHVAQVIQVATQVHLLGNTMANLSAQATAAAAATANASSTLQGPAREGSWMDMLDQISPGTNLSDFGSSHSRAEANRKTSLTTISFASCGYAKLPHLGLGIDQSAIESVNAFAATAARNPVFTKRYNALSPAMMSSKWQYLGEIVQEVDLDEYAALEAGWNLRHGWEDAEAARAVEFDGLLSGGTGRFTGKVQRSDRVARGVV